MSTVAGIDLSSFAVDVVLVDEDTDSADWHRFPLAGVDAFDRARNVREAMPSRSWWDDHGVVAVGIEQPRGNYGVTPLFRVQGAILACLPPLLLVQPWNPSAWRLAVGLKGNASKAEVRAAAIELGADAAWSSAFDPYDAFMIASATQSVIEIGETHGRHPGPATSEGRAA